MLELSHFGVPGRFFSFMRQQQLGLFRFRTGCSLLNITFAGVEVFPLLIELTLQVKHLPLFFLLKEFKFLRKPFIQLTLFLVPLVHIA